MHMLYKSNIYIIHVYNNLFMTVWRLVGYLCNVYRCIGVDTYGVIYNYLERVEHLNPSPRHVPDYRYTLHGLYYILDIKKYVLGIGT